VVREAAGKAAQKRIREQYQWQRIAAEIEKAYFTIMGWPQPEPMPKKLAARAAAASGSAERRAG